MSQPNSFDAIFHGFSWEFHLMWLRTSFNFCTFYLKTLTNDVSTFSISYAWPSIATSPPPIYLARSLSWYNRSIIYKLVYSILCLSDIKILSHCYCRCKCTMNSLMDIIRGRYSLEIEMLLFQDFQVMFTLCSPNTVTFDYLFFALQEALWQLLMLYLMQKFAFSHSNHLNQIHYRMRRKYTKKCCIKSFITCFAL